MFPDTVKISDDMGETFEKCWLAATSPRFFREVGNQRAIENILILKACTEMENTLRKNGLNGHWDILFRTIANLVLGMVRIYQQQVNNLYENTKCLETRYHRLDSTLFAHKTSQGRKCGKKKQNTNICVMSATLSQMYSVLELNEEEEKLLNSTDCLVQPETQISLPESAIRTEMYSDQFTDEIDLGEMQMEDVEYLMGSIRYGKRNHCEERDDDADSDATEIFEIPPKRGRHSDVINGAGPLQNNNLPNLTDNNLADEVNSICEQDFEYNILTTSTPMSSNSRVNSGCVNNASTPISSPVRLVCSPLPLAETMPSMLNFSPVGLNYDDLDTTEEFEIPLIEKNNPLGPTNEFVLQPLEKTKKTKKQSKLIIDLTYEISNQSFVKQLDLPKMQRANMSRKDCVPLFEQKKVNSTQLITTPCHRSKSKPLAEMFNRRLKKRKEPRNKNILNYILDIPCPAVDVNKMPIYRRTSRKVKYQECSGEKEDVYSLNCIYNSDVDLNCQASKRRKMDVNGNVLQDNEQSLIVEPLNRNIARNREPDNSTSLPELTREEMHRETCRVLEKCWSKRQRPINMTTVCGNAPPRKVAALMFMTILELNAKGYLEIIKDPQTQEIIHISKRQQCREKA